jgi:hypothetical protein
VTTYCELGLYRKAISATSHLNDHGILRFDSVVEVARHAQRSGNVEIVDQIVSLLQRSKPKDEQQLSAKALVLIARTIAKEDRRKALKPLQKLTTSVNNLEWTNQASEFHKDFAVALAEAGDFHSALEQIQRINETYFITTALIQLGMLSRKGKHAA